MPEPEVVGRLRRLEGRPRRLGRDPPRLPRRRGRRPALGRERVRCSWTRSRRACCSRRASAAAATGGTRSSTASRPTCRGASRSTPSTAPPATSNSRRPSTRPSSTSSSTTSIGVGRAAAARPALPHQAAGAVRALRRRTTRFGRFFEELLRIDPAHEFAGLRLNFWVSIVVFVALDRVLHLVAVHPRRRRGRPRPDRAGAQREPEGPTMAIPKGRVRPAPLASGAVVVRELELDLDAFEGPFDLLLTLVLREELDLARGRRRRDRRRVRRAAGRARTSSTSRPAASSSSSSPRCSS